MLASIHKFFSQNVITIPLNIPLSMAIGYYIEGTKGMASMAVLSIADLALKYHNFDSYYLSFASLGNMAGKKVATSLISYYKCLNTKCSQEPIVTDKIDVLDHLLPVSISAMGIIAAYVLNGIEHNVVEYINDSDFHTLEDIVTAYENTVVQNLEVL